MSNLITKGVRDYDDGRYKLKECQGNIIAPSEVQTLDLIVQVVRFSSPLLSFPLPLQPEL